MGGIAAMYGYNRGVNPVTEMIDKSIDRDIAAQKSNFEMKKSKAESANSLYAMGMQQFGNEREAELFARQMSYDIAAREAQRFTDAAQVETQKAAGNAMVADLRQKSADKAMERDKMVVHNQLHFIPKQTVAGGPSIDTTLKRALEWQKLTGGTNKPPSALGKRLQVRVHEEIATNDRAINALAALEELNRHPEAFAPTEARGRAEAASAALEEAGIKHPPNASSLLSAEQQGLVEGYRSQLMQKRNSLQEAWDIARGPEGEAVQGESGTPEGQ
jgi:hypothetical protein